MRGRVGERANRSEKHPLSRPSDTLPRKRGREEYFERDVRVIAADLRRRSHRAALVRLLDEYRAGPTGEGKPLDPEVKRRLPGDLSRHPMARVYLAVAGKTIAGAATCFLGYSTFQGRPLINFHDIVVERRFRRRGVATALLRKVEEAASEEGCCRLTLEVRADNKAALGLYRRTGFSSGPSPMLFLTKTVEPCAS
jgi:GNAT superfamily N-acetyltransferase